MIAREKRRRAAEDSALAALKANRKPWVGAYDLARATGLPWRIVARALLRMVAAGKVEEKFHEWKDANYRPRETRLYRASVAFNASVWPEFLMPRVKTSLGTSARRAQLQRENGK